MKRKADLNRGPTLADKLTDAVPEAVADGTVSVRTSGNSVEVWGRLEGLETAATPEDIEAVLQLMKPGNTDGRRQAYEAAVQMLAAQQHDQALPIAMQLAQEPGPMQDAAQILVGVCHFQAAHYPLAVDAYLAALVYEDLPREMIGYNVFESAEAHASATGLDDLVWRYLEHFPEGDYAEQARAMTQGMA